MRQTDPPVRVRESRTLAGLIRLGQYLGRGNSRNSFNVLQDTFVESGENKRTESDHEATGLDEFLVRFPRLLEELTGKRVLDFGCGYGGKAVELARRLPGSYVIGIDVHQKKIDKGQDFGARKGVANCEFRLCTQESVPMPDQSVDAVVCHDVLEHVREPAIVISEMHRVLKKDGKAYIVFPPYDGPVSHHLDFITSMPGLHWIYPADTVMRTVNSMLTSEYGKRFRTPPQPPATYSKYARKRVLPSLNGLGTSAFVELTKGLFRIERIERITLMDRLTKFGFSVPAASRVKSMVLRLFRPASDYLTMSMAIVLQKV
jgi:ubiquinone/menaquinone biosynthesis C-methylase UbiE